MTDHWLNPDPLHPRGTDDIMPSAEYVAGYDAGYEDAERARPPLLQATAFGIGVFVGMALAAAIFLAAAAR